MNKTGNVLQSWEGGKKDWEGSKKGWGWRLLNRFKTVNGVRYQLHATKGWRKV